MKKVLRDWGIIGLVFLLLYATGMHTEVAGFAQRMILSTGLITADINMDPIEISDDDFNFKLKRLNGETINFEDLKGKVIFLNLWATWCPPCIAEMPGIQSLYEKVDSNKVEFIMLSVNDQETKTKGFIDKKGYTFPVYTAASNVPNVFRSGSIPTTFIISKQGKIVSKKVGMANYDKKSFINFLEKLSNE
jgi:thiol-disulfide isomerase/thioredoxin